MNVFNPINLPGPEININENARVSHLLQVEEVQNSPNSFDLNPMTFDLDLRPLTFVTLTLETLTLIYSETRLKTGIFTLLTLVTLTFDL